ncbi:MAG: hypothetical protein HQL03_15265 [Nitrospirae bacterium]|nr:hypothetical protein [Nitrospirota bacterium]
MGILWDGIKIFRKTTSKKKKPKSSDIIWDGVKLLRKVLNVEMMRKYKDKPAIVKKGESKKLLQSTSENEG